MVAGAVVYKVYQLNYWGVVWSLLIVLLAMVLFKPYLRLKPIKFNWLDLARTNYYLLAFIILLIPLVLVLFDARTSEAIISPWQSLGLWFWILYFIELALLVVIVSQSSSSWLFVVIPFLALSYGIALIVYGVGYGYDPFIHQATEKYIVEHGAVDPKPLYYAGQYAFVVIINKLLFIPIAWLDRGLVIILSACFLPLLLWQSFKDIFQNMSGARLTLLLVALLGASLFIISTPQNLAYLFLALLVVVTLRPVTINWPLAYSLAGAALVTQAISGIPALLALLSLQIYLSRIAYRRIFVTAGLALMALILPLTFYLLDKSYNPSSQIAINNFDWSWLWPTWPNQFTIWLNFSYWWASVLPIILIIAVVSGWYHNHKLQSRHHNHYQLYFWFGLAMILAYLLTKLVAFSFLIDYERDNYANRILVSAIIFWMPFLAIASYEFVNRILGVERRQRLVWLIIGCAMLSANLYLAYPRYDQYHNSHSYATSASDLKAVQWINADANGTDYVVLANQQVSAAALDEFGFAKYYHGNIFYYPVPTSGQLYQYYLAITQSPDPTIIEATRQLVGAETVYVVINEYWHQAKKIIPELELMADVHYKVDGGKVHVFKFLN